MKKKILLLTASYGTGHLTMVLAEMGYKVSGSDISSKMIEKGIENANSRNLDIKLSVCDFRHVSDKVDGEFDLVACTGNSLGHVDEEGVYKALYSMDKLIKAGGYIYIDLRNWDRIMEEKNRFFVYNPFFIDGERVNLVQVWDYPQDGTVTFNLLYTFEKDYRIYRKQETSIKYYPLLKDKLLQMLMELGYRDIEINNFIDDKVTDFKEMQWYSVIARKSHD